MRHRWSEPLRFFNKTERTCINPGCAIVKVTRHDPLGAALPWTEFWRGLDRLDVTRTPACEAITDEVEA